MNRKERDYTNELTYTLDEIEDKEKLIEDCKKAEKANRHMEYIKAQFRRNYEEDRIEFIMNRKPPLSVEEHLIINEYTDFLKERA